MTDRRDLPVVNGGSGEGALPMDRRHALKVLAIAAAAPAVASCAPDAPDGTVPAADAPAPTNNPLAAGTPWDPDLVAPTVPWSRSMAADELEGLAALCDVIIPADDRSPSASQVGAHDFIDEWVSAPYDGNEADRVLVRGGLAWLDQQAAARYAPAERFRDLSIAQMHSICDEICHAPAAAPEHQFAARFFDRVRDLTSTAFWTTPQGMNDLGYVGNVPLQQWDPPPPEVLRHLGLD